jgi:hypothetical protein
LRGDGKTIQNRKTIGQTGELIQNLTVDEETIVSTLQTKLKIAYHSEIERNRGKSQFGSNIDLSGSIRVISNVEIIPN